MDDLLSEFLTETSENLATLDVEIVRLEQNPNDRDLLSNIFRLVHTIKGTCGFLGLPRLEAVAHAGENVLGKFRDGELEVTPTAVSLIFASLDRIKEILSVLEETEAEPEGDDQDLIDQLNMAAEGKLADMQGGAGAAAEAPVEETAEEEAVEEVDEDVHPDLGRPLMPGEVSLDELERVFQETAAEPEPPVDESGEAEHPEQEDEHPIAASSDIVPAKTTEPKPAAGAAGENAPKESQVSNQTIRVSVDLLENLMTMVSELVLTRNQLLQIVRNYKDSEFQVPLQRLSHVTSELQEGVMKTRMQPIGNAWAKLPRIIRDLSIELNKKIDLQMIGAETELDRQVLELIKDPLTHMVRNSGDHGIEAPEDRKMVGKSETGTITLNAFHEGGHIIIEISDDGKGLNLDKIKAKAIQNGLATEADVENMSDQQIQQFIFKAGFSTAAQVTAVSGRGVGMDVVRTNIEKIGGTIELNSVEGKGSRFTIKIPLTLAIVSALVVEAGGERFAIPQISVVELVRAAENSEHQIEEINGTPVLRLRDRLLPLVSLRRILDLGTDETQEEGAASRETFIVVSQVGTYTFGIIVDRVFDTEEIVVKPVAPILRHISLFSGNTILGDGSVIMILDPNGIAAATGEITITDDADQRQVQRDRAMDASDVTSLLLFRAGGSKQPRAVPLALVARLEELEAEKIEFSDGQPVVQYRGKLMPLVPIAPGFMPAEEGHQPVLVFADGDRAMGLMVDEIVDIVEDRININLSADTPGYMGTAIISGQATEVIDAGYFLQQAFADWFQKSQPYSNPTAGRARHVLLVDDSAFFRNLLTPVLSVAGFMVTTAEGPEAAMKLCEEGKTFDAIVSDIEMPNIDGFEFASQVRGSAWADVPIIALSSHTDPEDLDRGREVGFEDYVAKSDRDALIDTLNNVLSQDA
ncbi:MAG: chemotaxis protein CheW [Alphaproteobacteria bacterium]|nr:chemotaxis protein CheW [Alphaproteobacteria bacterium]